MCENVQIDLFCNEVDQLLQTGGLVDSVEPITDEYTGALSVAQTLSSIDFSHGSKNKHTLRQRLLAGIDPREDWSQNQNRSISMSTLFQKHGTRPALPVIILVGLLGLMFANLIYPGSVSAAAKSVVSFVQNLWVNEHTSINPIPPDRIFEMEDGSLAIQGEFSGENGTERKGFQSGSVTVVELGIRRFDNLAEAQVNLPFRLAQPGFLPEAYVFSHVSVFGEGNLASAHLHYYGPGGDLLLSQRPVGEQTGQTVSIGLPDNYIIDLVQVNGQPATWAEHVLLWEANDMSYLLSRPDLDLSEAISIAESLH